MSIETSEKAYEYGNTVYVNVLVGIIKRWIKTDMVETPKELTGIFYELIG